MQRKHSALTSAVVVGVIWAGVVVVFHAAFDIATTTPTTTTLIPTVTVAVITIAGLAVIPSLARSRRSDRVHLAPAQSWPGGAADTICCSPPAARTMRA